MDFCYTFEQKVKNYIDDYGMIMPGEHIIVGVSGGADSMCLLEVLRRFAEKESWKITAVHVHHGIRGQEADEDEQFVEQFCRQRGVSYESRHFQVPLEAGLAGEGEEEAGRRLRYQAFEEIRQRLGADKIALAHHRDDQAETVLFHLIRGSGLKGLCGMQPVNGNKIRPLLNVRKKEICCYLEAFGISWRTDQSNFSEQYARNHLRLRILPLLEQVNAGAAENISRAAGHLSETEEYMRKQTEEAAIRLGLCRKEGIWKKEPLYIGKKEYEQEAYLIRKRVLYDGLCSIAGSRKDLQECHVLSIDGLFSKQAGKRILLPYGMQARRDSFGVWLERRCGELAETVEMPLFSRAERMQVPGGTGKNSQGFLLSGRKKMPKQGKILEWKLFYQEKNAIIPKNNYTKWFDYDKISCAALFRTRRAGDWFVMDSSGRRKKLKQYFIDEKIPSKQRETTLLLVDGSHVIWIVGGRISEEYKVREATRMVLELRIVSDEKRQEAD